uniref:Uncharacterized protein n=1 Tax=Anopheles coluzzii TaxID=1518534 RepID=A0A8W7P1H2_ANOCL
MAGTTVTEGPNPLVAYSNQSELDKQLALQHYPEPLLGSDEVCPGPAGAPAGSLRMMLMMIPPSTVRPEDVDVPRGSVSSWVSVSSAPKGHNINLTRYRKYLESVDRGRRLLVKLAFLHIQHFVF